MKKSALIILCILLSWLVFAQGCMSFRSSDASAIRSFGKSGIPLHTATVKAGEIGIHYVQTGADSLPTLLFIHGSPGSWTAFEPYLRDSLLRSRYRMVSMDRPGFGYSNYGKAMNLAEQSRQMGPVIRQLKNGRELWLVGHSLGGPMVLQLQLDYPQLADGLVIISGSIDPAAEKPEKWRGLVGKTPLSYFLPGAFRPSNLEIWYLKSDLKQLEPRLSGIRVPVYFIHGRKDSWVPPVNVDFGQKNLTAAPFIDTSWLPAGHFIPWTHFREIRSILLNIKKG